MESEILKPDKRWIAFFTVKISAICLCLALLFYNSLTGFLFALPYAPILWKCERISYRERIKRKIKENFKDFLSLLSGNLGAGYSLENSFCQSVEEYKNSFDDSVITYELEKIVKGLNYNKRLEDMLIDFANRVKIKEIKEFATLIVVSKSYGGNIIKLVRQTSDNYRENFMTELEIQTMTASKKFESRIMLFAPVMIILFMRFTNGEYMGVLYDTVFGNALMTVCLALLMAAFRVTNKIIQIEV